MAEKYNGHPGSCAEFFKQFLYISNINGWDDAAKVAVLPAYLTGAAYYFYIKITSYETTFQAIQEAFMSEFAANENNATADHYYGHIEQSNKVLTKEVEDLKEEVVKLQKIIQQKCELMEEMSLSLQEVNLLNKKLKQECHNLNETNIKLSEGIVSKDNVIKAIRNELADARRIFAEEFRVKEGYLESAIKKLACVTEEKKALEIKFENTSKERDFISNKLNEKEEEILNLQEKNNALEKIVQNNEISSQALHLELKQEKQSRIKLITKHNDEYGKMKEKLLESENKIELQCKEIAKLKQSLKDNIKFNKELRQEVVELKDSVSKQNENCKVLERNNNTMLNDKRLNIIENVYSEEKGQRQLDDVQYETDTYEDRINELNLQKQIIIDDNNNNEFTEQFAFSSDWLGCFNVDETLVHKASYKDNIFITRALRNIRKAQIKQKLILIKRSSLASPYRGP